VSLSKVESAEKNLPSTKESLDKRNGLSGHSFSEREHLTGSLSEEDPVVTRVLLREESAHATGAYEGKSHEERDRHDKAARVQPTSISSRAVAEATTGRETSRPRATTLESVAGPGYLRQLVQDPVVDYAEVRRFLLNYQDACRKLFPQQEPPSSTWRREGKLVADLLRQHPYERLLRLLNRFLRQECGPHPQERRPQGEDCHGHDCSLGAFAQAIPTIIAQAREEMAQGTHHPATGFPIRLWREKEALTIQGTTGRAVIGQGKRLTGKPADSRGGRWTWHKEQKEWTRGDGASGDESQK